MRRIVVGIDGAEQGRRVLAWAAGEARRTGAVLVIVHAWTVPASAHGSLVVPNFSADSTRLAHRDAARAKVDASLASADLDGVRFEVRLVEGTAGEALVDAGEGATMVVVGHRARGGLAELVLGSTARYVTRRATVPVLVVPEMADLGAVA